METTRAPRVLIADSQELIREAYRSLLERHPAVEVVGVARDGEEALREAIALQPTVVMVDAELPRLGGLAVTERMRERCPEVGIILFLAKMDRSARTFLKEGPAGKACLLRSSIRTVDSLVRIILDIADGRTILDPTLVKRLTNGDTFLNQLTEREMDVLGLMAEGLSNGAIGERLFLRPKTVEYHINRIFSKLDVAHVEYQPRVQAVLTFLGAWQPASSGI